MASSLENFPINLDYSSRYQILNLDAEAFISHVAPKLLKRINDENTFRSSVFRCLIRIRNCDTTTFRRSWIKEYGITNSLTQEIINLLPYISRLISLTDTLIEFYRYQHSMNQYGVPIVPIVPTPNDIDQETNNYINCQLEEIWLMYKNEFVEKCLNKKPILEIVEWMPERFVQLLQECPIRLHKSLDWEFLSAGLIPVLETEQDNQNADILLNSLCKEVILVFLHESKKSYTNQTNKNNRISNTQIYPSQSKLLNVITKPLSLENNIIIDQVINVMDNLELV
ncbi:hypothetical protein A0J48_024955, partial [Sphaerospermopsis aphanizomenoides BCCUSP55]|uniref:hypothetical protein n=1 Tax=Sphaerospermopsis aphanizomenoides TaxID=459663 RepID=UPI0019057713